MHTLWQHATLFPSVDTDPEEMLANKDSIGLGLVIGLTPVTYIPYQLTYSQVSTVADADRVEKLGVNRIVGLGLVLIWLAVLVTTIVLRRRVDYASHEPLLCALIKA